MRGYIYLFIEFHYWMRICRIGSTEWEDIFVYICRIGSTEFERIYLYIFVELDLQNERMPPRKERSEATTPAAEAPVNHSSWGIR